MTLMLIIAHCVKKVKIGLTFLAKYCIMTNVGGGLFGIGFWKGDLYVLVLCSRFCSRFCRGSLDDYSEET